MGDGIDQTWRKASSGTIPMREWDGDWIVYNPLSGDTHILDIVAGEVLRAVADGPSDGRALCGRIAEFLDVADDANTAASVAEILRRLDELGLIEPVPAC